MNGKTRLELTWIGKEERPRLEPRILIEEPSKSYHGSTRGENDIFDNILIHGDNLLALKALEASHLNSVKCIYIDPPYNTGSAFNHYDDGIEHSLWLSLLRDRLVLLRNLLSMDGSIWINLDDNEGHYCKVLCDEIFGRTNFLADVIWEKSDSPRMDAEFFSVRHDHLFVYAKEIAAFKINKGVTVEGGVAEHYNKKDETGRPYYLKPLRAMGGDDARADRPTLFFPLEAPDGAEVLPKRKDGSDGRWRWGKERTDEDAHLIEWIKGREGWSPYYRIYGDTESRRPPETIWPHGEVGSNRTSKAETKALFGGTKSFETPKPERLIERVIALSTQPGDCVLDSFGGSGTTGAVAHKMGRRWIMVELGENCDTHIVPRLRKVIDGADAGGITKAVAWMGGGGFRYFHLAPSLVEADRWGNAVISKKYNAAMLAEAMCAHLGFTYAPSPNPREYWKHGYSSERDFLFVTTKSLTAATLRRISEDVGPERTLLICCKAFDTKFDAFENLTLKKIPQAVLANCEWGRDDYSLRVSKLPERENEPEPAENEVKPKRAKNRSADSPSLFDRGA
jgi:adenine-specific DNA-methyltransferase